METFTIQLETELKDRLIVKGGSNVDGRTDGWIDGWMVRWMDGWLDGWLDG